MGLVALIGPQKTLVFFLKKKTRMGSVFFFGGMFLIILGWFLFTTIGFLCQVYGLWIMFRSFIPTLFSTMQTLPVVGPFLRNSTLVHQFVAYANSEGKQ